MGFCPRLIANSCGFRCKASVGLQALAASALHSTGSAAGLAVVADIVPCSRQGRWVVNSRQCRWDLAQALLQGLVAFAARHQWDCRRLLHLH